MLGSFETEDAAGQAELIFDRYGPDKEIDLFKPREDYHLEYWRLLSEESHGRHSGSHPFPV